MKERRQPPIRTEIITKPSLDYPGDIEHRSHQLLEQIQQNLDKQLDDNQKRRIVSYVTIMIDPVMLPALGNNYGVTPNMIQTYAREASEIPYLRNIARTVLDHYFEVPHQDDQENDLTNTNQKQQIKKDRYKVDIIEDQENLEMRLERALSNLEELLTPEENQIVTLTLNEKTLEEIAQQLQMKYKQIEYIKSQARKKIEKQRFEPVDLQRLGRIKGVALHGNRLATAAKRKRFPAVMFMNRYYTDPMFAHKKEKNKLGNINKSIDAIGVLPLIRALPHNLYRKVLNEPEYQKYIVVINGVKCIYQSDAENIISEMCPPGYVRLVDLAQNEKDKERLRKAYEDGRLEGIKPWKEILVQPEEVEEYNKRTARYKNYRMKTK